MYELFFQKFNELVPLDKKEQDEIEFYLTPKKIRKKQYLLQEGDVCKFITFVEKGSLRAFVVDETGGEHVIRFALRPKATSLAKMDVTEALKASLEKSMVSNLKKLSGAFNNINSIKQ